MGRINLAVDAEIARRLKQIARDEGKTLYALTNEYLGEAIRVKEAGIEPRHAGRLAVTYSLLSGLDIVMLPGDMVDKILSKLYALEKEWLLRYFYMKGRELSTYLKLFARDLRDLINIYNDLQGFLPIKKNKIEMEGNRLYVSIIGAGRVIESTLCTLKFIEGIIEAYGWKIVKQQVEPGIIIFEATTKKT